MAENLTEQQRQAVTDRGGNLLVSAAAGSGKTKVLVDRLLSYLTDSQAPAQIDEFLIITYTKAAASELRVKIAMKLSEQIAAQPNNLHLQRQLQRLHLTKISTVHSFCADILREYSYLLDIPSDFRVADEDECVEMQSRAIARILEAAYEQAENNQQFRALVDTQGFGRDDRRIPEIILKVYRSAFCHKEPERWLNWCEDVAHISCDDVAQTVWGRYLVDDLFRYLDLQISALNKCVELARAADHMEKPVLLLQNTLDQLRMMRNCKTWNEICEHRNIDFGRLVFSSKVTDVELADQIKSVRSACKAGIEKKLVKFADKSDALLSDYVESMTAAKGLIEMVKSFVHTYSNLKSARRVLDFSDLEHKMLDLLIGRSRTAPTLAAREIGSRFREVMVDEYQDSNEVQDAIFSALTEARQNCFMVGDVKQSIYQFRLADPSIFIEKYNRYVPAHAATIGQGRKVILSKNFRSCGNVIHAVNDVFRCCMSSQVGGLNYGEEEALHEGIPHVPVSEREIELFGIEVQEDTYHEEAAFVADKIQNLLDGTHMVREGEVLRPIIPDDIVILLRSPGSVGGEYQSALESVGIRCSFGSGGDLLQTEEVQTLLALLQTINNPLQDIPLVCVLSSRVFCFSSDELAAIRARHKGGNIYSALSESDLDKSKHFLHILTQLREAAQLCSVSQLIAQIFSLTRLDSIFAAMPDGDIRVENLQSFCRLAVAFEANAFAGLNRFLEHLSLIADRGIPIQSESGTGAVTIMSIHKSKGLEFPVVFICGLARRFNQEDLRAQVLCDKDLGLGLSKVDEDLRVQYPTFAKNAIVIKQRAEVISEELRVLYVAMTRAKDRLIMTYSSPKVRKEVEELTQRMALSDPILLTSTADCPGRWVLMTAIANADNGWSINYTTAPEKRTLIHRTDTKVSGISRETILKIKDAVSFVYPHQIQTRTPSKQTATQLKGRYKDVESAENSPSVDHFRSWRRPVFAEHELSAIDYGNAMHAAMQYISFERCLDSDSVNKELNRLVAQKYLSKEQASAVNPYQIAAFFETEIGVQLRKAEHVLREFKFSLLVENEQDFSENPAEKILLQGVVDCALITEKGIHIIDFKTDSVTDDSLLGTAEKYRTQLSAYSEALSRIYQLPVVESLLYFFKLNRFVRIS